MSENDPSSLPAVRRANFWSTLSVICVCVTLAWITHQLFRPPPSLPPARLWTPIVVTGGGEETIIQAGTRRLEFWTPSGRTRDYLARDGGAVRDRDKWEAIPSDEPVQQFGALLRTNSDVLGYRRAEVWGQGHTIFKPGWWWTITVTTNYSAQNLVHAYRGFWKSTNTIYVERIENPGQE
ncbi:MAG: hypothetical protein QOF48_605 [Verrucomicrobiota bacterium]|jgi:hypothetical protein